jgi:Flp pilus assembly protein TadB
MPLAARRAIAIGMLLLAALLVWSLAVLPLRGVLLSQQEWRAETAREIARDRGVAKNATQLREMTAAVDASPLRARLYDGAGGMAVTDQLQNDLRAALLQSGVEPTTFKVLPGSLVSGLRAHRVEFSSVMTVEQLRVFFVALATQPHFVRVERLQLNAPEQQRSDENPRVSVLMEARAFALDVPAATPDRRVARAY